MKRRVFNFTSADTVMIGGSAKSVASLIRKADGNFEVTEKCPVVGNDDILIIRRLNGKITVNDSIKIPATLLAIIRK